MKRYNKKIELKEDWSLLDYVQNLSSREYSELRDSYFQTAEGLTSLFQILKRSKLKSGESAKEFKIWISIFNLFKQTEIGKHL